mmetsp:Transcript_22672/g.37910  ORF Transcript_22672/g.37910 Transcript_22672/m.37910 type:complete len:81 (-) Transcript_22672:3690-3932(-)
MEVGGGRRKHKDDYDNHVAEAATSSLLIFVMGHLHREGQQADRLHATTECVRKCEQWDDGAIDDVVCWRYQLQEKSLTLA